MKIRPVGDELFLLDRRTDVRTNGQTLTEVIIAFRSLANAHINDVNPVFVLCCELLKHGLGRADYACFHLQCLPKYKCLHHECLSQYK
jgi:hypothetical protein